MSLPLQQARLYLSVLHGGRRGWIEIRARSATGAIQRAWYPTTTAGIHAAAAQGLRWSAAGADVYTSVLARAGHGQGRAEHVLQAGWLAADVDSGADGTEAVRMLVSIARDRFGVPAPDMLVASGSGGWHCYWRLCEAVPLLDDSARRRYGELLRRLAQAIGGTAPGAHADPCTVAQCLRLPGAGNHKHTPPRPVRLLRCCPASPAWSAARWSSALPALRLPPPPPARRDCAPAARLAGLLRTAERPIAVGARHRELAAYARWLARDAAAPPDLVEELVTRRAALSPGPPMPKSELRAIARWGYRP